MFMLPADMRLFMNEFINPFERNDICLSYNESGWVAHSGGIELRRCLHKTDIPSVAIPLMVIGKSL